MAAGWIYCKSYVFCLKEILFLVIELLVLFKFFVLANRPQTQLDPQHSQECQAAGKAMLAEKCIQFTKQQLLDLDLSGSEHYVKSQQILQSEKVPDGITKVRVVA